MPEAAKSNEAHWLTRSFDSIMLAKFAQPERKLSIGSVAERYIDIADWKAGRGVAFKGQNVGRSEAIARGGYLHGQLAELFGTSRFYAWNAVKLAAFPLTISLVNGATR